MKYLTWINFRVDLFSRMPTLKKLALIYFHEGRITKQEKETKKLKLYCKSFVLTSIFANDKIRKNFANGEIRNFSRGLIFAKSPKTREIAKINPRKVPKTFFSGSNE